MWPMKHQLYIANLIIYNHLKKYKALKQPSESAISVPYLLLSQGEWRQHGPKAIKSNVNTACLPSSTLKNGYTWHCCFTALPYRRKITFSNKRPGPLTDQQAARCSDGTPQRCTGDKGHPAMVLFLRRKEQPPAVWGTPLSKSQSRANAPCCPATFQVHILVRASQFFRRKKKNHEGPKIYSSQVYQKSKLHRYLLAILLN